jgi:DNA-binding CsgD family transcriptional regulator
VTYEEAKQVLIAEAPDYRDMIMALPDRDKLDALGELERCLIETRLQQLLLVGRINRAYMKTQTHIVLGKPLTEREEAVAKLLCAGLANHEIADEVGISVKTVDTHRHHVLIKLGLKNNASLALHGVREGWISQHE